MTNANWHTSMGAGATLYGSGAPDRFLSQGNETVHGGAGHDVVYVPTLFADRSAWVLNFTRGADADGVSGTIQFSGKTLSFSNIEEIRFLDGALSLGMDDLPAHLSRISLGLTGHMPTADNLAHYVDAIQRGNATSKDFADAIVVTDDFEKHIGLPNIYNRQNIVHQMYSKIAGWSPNQVEVKAWTDILTSFGHALTGYFADSSAAKSWSKEMWRDELNAGVWVEKGDLGTLSKLLYCALGRNATSSEVSQWLYAAERESLTAAQLSERLVAAYNLDDLDVLAFVKVLSDHSMQTIVAAEDVERLVHSVASGALGRGEALLLTAMDPLFDVRWSAANPAGAIKTSASQNFEISQTPFQVLRAAQDFDGDARADVLWRNEQGWVSVWTMDSTNIDTAKDVWLNPGTWWEVRGSGDFNGDSRDDVLWRGNDGTIAIWHMDGASIVGGGILDFNPGTAWAPVAAGDFNGDGFADILWRGQDGSVCVWEMNGTTVIGGGIVDLNPGNWWQIRGAGDFNGDGRDDIL